MKTRLLPDPSRDEYVYWLSTYNQLPLCKGLVETARDAWVHVEYMLSLRPRHIIHASSTDWSVESCLLHSTTVVKINKTKCPEYSKIFLERKNWSWAEYEKRMLGD